MMKTYPVDDGDLARLDEHFEHHAPGPRQVQKFRLLRGHFKRLATDLMQRCPPSRERSLALTKLEESLMWANASVARHEPMN